MDSINVVNISYKVLVLCLTYNQSKYIKDTLNGFVLQKTNFPFLCLVLDDCSIDGEQEVILDWILSRCEILHSRRIDSMGNLIISQSISNTNCKIACLLQNKNLNSQIIRFQWIYPLLLESEYIAYCEGDDYWIDSSKLQCQYDTLARNRHINLCVHGHSIRDVYHDSVKNYLYRNRDFVFSVIDTILPSFDIATSSIFIRSSILRRKLPRFIKHFVLDFTVLIYAALYEGGIYICRPMSVYRTNVRDSYIYKLLNEDGRYSLYLNKLFNSLDYFNFESNLQYHNIIQGKKLIEIIRVTHSLRQNINLLWLYRQYLFYLPFKKILFLLPKVLMPSSLQIRLSYIYSSFSYLRFSDYKKQIAKIQYGCRLLVDKFMLDGINIRQGSIHSFNHVPDILKRTID